MHIIWYANLRKESEMTEKEFKRTLKEIDPSTPENKREILKLFRNVIGYVLGAHLFITGVVAYFKCTSPINFTCFWDKFTDPYPYPLVVAGIFGLYRWIETEILDQEFPDD